MENLDLHRELEAFVEAIDTFPASEEKSKFYKLENIGLAQESALLDNYLGELEHRKALSLILKAQEAISLCKKSEIELGFEKFNEVYSKIPSLSSEAGKYANLYYLSGMAYYYFKIENYHKSLEFTWKELHETEKLEKMGITMLHYRRAGHVGNVIKILYKLGNIEEAVKLMLADLLYTLNGDTALMPQGEWNHELLNIIPYIRQRYFDISFLNVTEKWIQGRGNYKYNDTYIYNEVFSKIPEFEVTNNNLAMIYNWLYLQKMYYQNFTNEFILNSIEFFRVPFDSSFDSLKLSVLSNIIKLLKHSEIEKNLKEKYGIQINNYILNNLNSKQILKDNICNFIFE